MFNKASSDARPGRDFREKVGSKDSPTYVPTIKQILTLN